MRLNVALSSILAGICIFFLFAPTAEAYVGLAAGSFIAQLSIGSFLVILLSTKAIVSMIFKSCAHQVKEFRKSIWQAVGKCKSLIGFSG